MEDSEPPTKRRRLSHTEANDEMNDTLLDSVGLATKEPSGDNDTNEEPVGNDVETNHTKAHPDAEPSSPTQQLSKKQMKRLRKREEWEAGRESRKARRKEKNQEKKIKKREQKKEAREARQAQGLSPTPKQPTGSFRPVVLPIAIVIDCGFDDKMAEKERISLGAQVTRSYSDNSKAPFQAHMYISSWGGLLKERFDTLLRQQHHNWKGVRFTSEDFVEAARMADVAMKDSRQNAFAGAFKSSNQSGDRNDPVNGQKHGDEGTGIEIEESTRSNQTTEVTRSHPNPPSTSIEELEKQGEVIYLTSDSPYTLTELKPFSTYIVGGLVDKNRHKGICYKTACDKGIKTAKLPIGRYMEMQSRFILATNHVVEIMVRWLECGDWGEAFMKVIPKRKGGKLREGRENGELEIELEAEDEVEVELEDEDEDEDEDEEEKEVGDEEGDERIHGNGVSGEVSASNENVQS